MVKIRKTVKHDYHPHREHGSKKNKWRRRVGRKGESWKVIIDFRRRKEKLKLKDHAN